MQIDVHIIGGYLGSGKTTAVLHLLQACQTRGERCAVLVNEFGQQGIDGHLLNQGQPTLIKEIKGGCICCTLLPDMARAIQAIAREKQLRRLFVEPTGLASPRSFEHLFNEPGLHGAFKLRPLLTLIDPNKFFLNADKAMPYFETQLRQTDILVANKTDLASPEALDRLRIDFARFNPDGLLISTQFGRIPLELLEREAKAAPTAPVPVENLAGKTARLGYQQPAKVIFDSEKLRALFDDLARGCHRLRVRRAKGIFRCNDGWRVFQLSDSGVDVRVLTTNPSLSLCDILAETFTPAQQTKIRERLDGCIL
jgi:G3E family GTPase